MKKTLFTLFSLLCLCREADAFSVTHDFTVFIGPFNASQTSFTYALSPDSYAVASKVKTFGLFDTLYPFEARYATTGHIKNGKLETTSYKYQSQSRFTKRKKELIYNEQGVPVYRISSKNDKEKKVEITPDPKNNETTDLQTVFAELARQYNQVKFCDSRMEVFDGKRRFDVIFKDEGKEELAPNQFSPLTGTASKCSMYIDKLGSEGDDLLWQFTSDRPIYFWILADEKTGIPFIAHIEVEETPLGKMNVYTHNITIEE